MSRKLTKKIKQLLHNIYFNQDSKEGAYSSLINVLRVARRTIPDLSKSVVRDYLTLIPTGGGQNLPPYRFLLIAAKQLKFFS